MVPGRGDVQQAHQPQAVQGHVSDVGVLVLDAGEQLRGDTMREAHTVSRHTAVLREVEWQY